MDLLSINYLHFGAPKTWYGVPPALAKRFEAMAEGYFGSERRSCAQFLRHKTTVISPKKVCHRLNESLQLATLSGF